MSKTQKRKRANGEGTFYQLQDKTWVHQITMGRKPDGSPDRKSFKGKTRAACIERREQYREDKARIEAQAEDEHAAQVAALLEAQKRGHSPESEALFGEAFMRWLKLFKSAPTKKASTYSSYLDIYNCHFAEFFGELRLCDISLETVQEYYRNKQLSGARKDGKKGGLSAKTIKNQHMLLKNFFGYAQEKYNLPSNPTLKAERPEVVTPDMRVLKPEEMLIFMKEVLRETQRIAILFCLFSGLRIGELLAAEVADLDVTKQSIVVTRNITRVKTEAIEQKNPHIKVLNYKPEKKTHLVVQDTAKTKNSHRAIPISDEMFMLLARHLYFLEQSNWPNPSNLLFPSTRGTYLDPKSFEIRLRAISKRCEIKKVNPHALRHTFATRLVEQGVPLTTVMELLGHASVSTTQRYVTTFAEEKRDAIEKVSTLLTPEGIETAARLNGAKERMRFADVRLPSWLQTEPSPAKT